MTRLQRTISREAVFEGIGLHTGSLTQLRFKPAACGSGITFVRTDLKGHPWIKALVENVVDVIRGTTIAAGNARLHTVEHVLSAVRALEIDNLEVEVNANEPPVADGSSWPFAQVLLEAGIVDQELPASVFAPQRPIVYTAGQTTITAEPAESLTLDCTIIYTHPLLSQQHVVFPITPETFLQEIARARTFCFDFEVEALKRNGLAKGGSLDNAVVVGMDRIHNKENGLRYPDEFVRHKMLDLLGDLTLLGSPLQAKITAVRPGHGHNIAFVKELRKELLASSVAEATLQNQ